MTKLNNEVIVAIAGAYEKIGQAHLEIAEYLKTLANGFPSIDEVVPQPDLKEVVKEEAKAPVEAKAQEEVAKEATGNIIETEEGEVNLDEMTLKELKEFADEYGVEYPKKVKKDELIAIIMQAVEEAGEEEDDDDVAEVDEDVAEEVEEAADEEDEAAEEEVAEDEEEERSTVITVETEDGEEEIDLEEMSVKELKDFAEEYGLEVTAKTKSAIIEEILDQLYDGEEADEEVEDDVEDVEEDSEDDGEEDLAEMYGLNELSLEELAEICAEHGLSTKGKRQALIDRIVRGIKDGTIEVEDEEEGE